MYGSYQDILEALEQWREPRELRDPVPLHQWSGRPLTEEILKEILYVGANKPFIRALQREIARQKRYGARFAVAVLEVEELLDPHHWRHALTHAEFENDLQKVTRESEAFFAFQHAYFFIFLLDVDEKLAETAMRRIASALGDKYHIHYGFGVYPQHGLQVADLICNAWNRLNRIPLDYGYRH